MLTSDSLVRRNDDVVLLKISGGDTPVITIVEIRRKVSRSNVVRDLFLPIRQHGDGGDYTRKGQGLDLTPTEVEGERFTDQS